MQNDLRCPGLALGGSASWFDLVKRAFLLHFHHLVDFRFGQAKSQGKTGDRFRFLSNSFSNIDDHWLIFIINVEALLRLDSWSLTIFICLLSNFFENVNIGFHVFLKNTGLIMIKS